MELRQYDKALDDFSKVIELEPKSVRALQERGWCYFNHLKQYDKALADFSRAIELEPKNAWAWNARAYAYTLLGQHHKALADSTKAIELAPEHWGYWNRRGAAYLELRQYDKALADLNKVIELEPKNAVVRNNRGVCYEHLGRMEKAVEDFSRAIELNPTAALSWRNRGLIHARLGQWDKAAIDASKVIELNPKDANAWYQRAGVNSQLGRYAEALADYSKAIELAPEHWGYWNRRAAAYLELRQYDKAIVDYSKVIELEPKSVSALQERGLCYFNHLKQYDKALADFTRAIKLEPKNASVWVARANAYSLLDQHREALDDLTKAIDLDPKNVSAWRERAGVYRKLHQDDKALADYSKVIALEPKNVVAWLRRSTVYVELGQYDKALADSNKAAELDPSCYGSLTHQFIATGRLQDGLRYYNGVIQRQPRDFGVWWLRGELYCMLGLWDLAAADFAKAFQFQAPSSPPLWFCHALLRVHIGDAEGYRKVVTVLLQHFKQTPARQFPHANGLARALTLAPAPDIDLDWAAKQAEFAVKNEAGPWSQNALGLVHYRAGKYEQALGPLREALRLDTHWRYAIVSHSVLAMAYHRLDRSDEARKTLTEATQKVDEWRQSLLGPPIDPWGDIWPWWADVLEGLVLYREAKILIEGAAPPEDPRPIVARARAFATLGAREQAEEACSRAMVLGAKNPGVHLACARVHAGLGRWEKVVADLSEGIEAAQDKKLPPDFYFLRAMAHVQLRRFAEAVTDYTKVQELAANSPVVHNDLARLLATCPDVKHRDPARAVELAKKAVKLAPKEGALWNTLGAAHYRKGDWKAAIEALDKSRKYRKGGDASDFFFLAMACWQLGQKDDARRWYKQAVRWVEKNSDALAKNPQWTEELRRFRAEAKELLNVKE
jgi:tetratricopeptide (TPR) repeat protein